MQKHEIRGRKKGKEIIFECRECTYRRVVTGAAGSERYAVTDPGPLDERGLPLFLHSGKWQRLPGFLLSADLETDVTRGVTRRDVENFKFNQN